MPLDLESLRCFEAAAHHLNFRAAAASVSLSPAAFGDRIRRLEAQLGARLFERTTRQVKLSAAGERLRSGAARALSAAEDCSRLVREDAPPAPFELSLGTRYELGLSWITPALTALERERPERCLHLAFGDTQELLARLRAGTLDCLITSARLATPGLDYARLHEEHYVFVGREGLLSKRPLRRAGEAAGHRLLDLDRRLPLFRYFLDARPGDESWSFDSVRFLGTIAPVRQQALAGAGVAVLPEYFVRADLERGRLVRILPRMKLPVDWFRMVWRAGDPRAGEIRELAASLARRPLR